MHYARTTTRPAPRVSYVTRESFNARPWVLSLILVLSVLAYL